MSDEKKKAVYNLIHTARKHFGDVINVHSPLNKEEHSLKDAYFPYVINQLKVSYNYFALFDKKYEKLTDEEKAVYNKRFSYIESKLYPQYKDSGLTMSAFISQNMVATHLNKLKKTYGVLSYDDTLSYDGVYVDFIKLDSFYSQLVYPEGSLFSAQQRYELLKKLSLMDLDVQEYINAWKRNKPFLDKELYKLAHAYSNSTLLYVRQQFHNYMDYEVIRQFMAKKGGE